MTLTVVQFLSAFERSRKLSGVSPSQSRKCQKRRSYCSQVSSALTASRKILTDSPSRWGNFLLVIPHILNPTFQHRKHPNSTTSRTKIMAGPQGTALIFAENL